MPRYSGVLAFLCLVAICIGINIIRYPAVSVMLAGKSQEQFVAENSNSMPPKAEKQILVNSGKTNQDDDSAEFSDSAKTTYRNYSSVPAKKSNESGNRPVSSVKSSFVTSSELESSKKTTDSDRLSGHSSKVSSEWSTEKLSTGKLLEEVGEENFSKNPKTEFKDGFQDEPYEKSFSSGEVIPGYASQFPRNTKSVETEKSPFLGVSGEEKVISAQERFEQIKNEPFVLLDTQNSKATNTVPYYIPPRAPISQSESGVLTTPKPLASFESPDFTPILLPGLENEDQMEQ